MVFEKLKGLICDQFGVEEETVTMDTTFREDLSADSLDMVELMMVIEEEFEVGEIDEAELQNIETIGDAVNFITSKTEG